MRKNDSGVLNQTLSTNESQKPAKAVRQQLQINFTTGLNKYNFTNVRYYFHINQCFKQYITCF